MREIIHEVETWKAAGDRIAVATNVKKQGASLRPLGAKMAVTTHLQIAGSVTGGCIEGAVYQEAQAVIQGGQPKLLQYGVVNEDAPWEVGLSCSGTLDVLIESLDSPAWQEVYPAVKACLADRKLAAVATVISGPGIGNKLMLWPDGHMLGGLGSERLEAEVKAWMSAQMNLQEPAWAAFLLQDAPVEIFVDVLVPEKRMFVVGAVHTAIPLVSLASLLGYQTIVIDPRKAFANRERFPHADSLILEWPASALEKAGLDDASYVAVISHDEKLDNPALAVALASPARYVGVLGTRKNLAKRCVTLRELGVSDEQLKRLRAPIGLKIGAIQPEEIALSILAEMVAALHGKLDCQETQVTFPVSDVS